MADPVTATAWNVTPAASRSSGCGATPTRARIEGWSFSAGDGETSEISSPATSGRRSAHRCGSRPVRASPRSGPATRGAGALARGRGVRRLSYGETPGVGRARSVPPQLPRARTTRGAARSSRSRPRSCRRGCSAATSPSRAWSGPISSSPSGGAGAGAGPDDDRRGLRGAGRPRGRRRCLLDILDAALAVLATAWPTATDVTLTRYLWATSTRSAVARSLPPSYAEKRRRPPLPRRAWNLPRRRVRWNRCRRRRSTAVREARRGRRGDSSGSRRTTRRSGGWR